ncbi:MAG TPA: DUF4153 domain-containing protein [Gemmatimonadales bacterium]|nr:DUF4153 domain-containing protein [Gemmatimonadales bacterium]
MRFPSIATLVEHAAAVLRRFPWTLLAGAVAAAAGIFASTTGANDGWTHLAFVAALGLPLTLALSLLGETRGWGPGRRTGVLLGGIAGLGAFFLAWPGIEVAHEAIRYFLLSAALHLTVAFLPFLGAEESLAFWQYNRRLFLGILRAVVFSGVLFVGIVIALGALDKLFGVHIPAQTYFRIWLILAFVVNTWIFLAAVPPDLAALARDTEYPRALKVFAQYVLTPLAFTYLVILLAYLIKIVAGGEWPSGWIGWLVASVSVTGLLGFLLVHPLRADPNEGWIRTYARWLFVGLVPSALMLLVAFWKRIVPYGLTEPRVLGLVLGLWLLAIALLFAARAGTSIRIIPISLAGLLLLTLYGPVSLTRVSISSQGRRLERLLRAGHPTDVDAREASAALRFLIDHRAGDEIAARIGRPLPPIDWKSTARLGSARDSLGRRIMALRDVEYVPDYGPRSGGGWFQMTNNDPLPVAGFDWVLPASPGDATTRLAGPDSVAVIGQPGTNVVRVRIGADTLEFDLRPLARGSAGSPPASGRGASATLRVEAVAGARRGVLSLTQLNGTRSGDSVLVTYWSGWVLVGRR